GQFGHFRDIRLAKQNGLARIEAEGEVVESDIANVLPQGLRVADAREGMVVGNEIETLRLVLQGNVLLDGAKVIAEVKLPRRLDAAQNPDRSLVGCHRWFVLCPGSFILCTLQDTQRKRQL